MWNILSNGVNVVYLETTAVIDKAFKTKPAISSIVEAADKSLTSQYVKMEIKQGFLNKLVLLHNKIVACEKWSDVEQFFANLNLSRQRYYLGAVLEAMAKFWGEIEQSRPADLAAKHGDIPLNDIFKRESRNFLSLWIRRLISKVEESADEMINPMVCFTDLDAPTRKGDRFDNKPVNCTDSAVECEIKKFFEENAGDFRKIYDGLLNLPEEQSDEETRKRIKCLKTILKLLHYSTRKFSNKSQNAELCWACGDAIHAVIAPRGARVLNNNTRHFDPICSFIGRESITY